MVFLANEVIDFYILALAFIAVSFVFTKLLKRYAKTDTFFIFSMFKTKKPLWVFDRLAVIGKPLDWLAEIGLVLGFGSIAVDYLYGRKRTGAERIALFAGSTIFLSLLFAAFDQLVGNSFSQGIFTKELFYPITVFVGLTGFAGFVLATLGLNAVTIIFNYLSGQGSCPGVAPVLPGVDVPNVPISVPLYAWIPLLAVVFLHEMMHGIVARKEKIGVKSTGILLLGFIPIGGFVEPDEEQLQKSDELKQLRVYAAGVATNIFAFLGTFAFIFALGLVISTIFGPWALGILGSSVKEVQINEVREKIPFCKKDYSSPSFGVLEKGMVVKEVNGQEIKFASDVTAAIAEQRHQPVKMLVEQNGKKSEIKMSPNELGLFGFGVKNVPNEGYKPPVEYEIYSFAVTILFGLLNWFLWFNLFLGMMNYLPFPALDGGRIAPIIFSPYLAFLGKSKAETQKLIMKVFFSLILALFLINALPLFF
ncbi:MAG: M50 family metallopeptidase [archaeon]